MAASSPIPRCNGCSTAARGGTRSLRQKEIRFSSRTRTATHQFTQKQMVRRTVAKLFEKLPKDLRHAKNYEGCSKDYEFSRRTMEEHWKSGYTDAVRTLRHPEVLQRPDGVDGVFTFDLAEQGREGSTA